MKIELRDYQTQAFEECREHIRQGRRRILINAPTGSGKTTIAMALMEMVAKKGRRSTFCADRISLIDQTSDMATRYVIEHGVLQADHQLYRPSKPTQICSVQTLQRRGWPDSDVDIFDEAHVLHAGQKKRIEEANSIVIGLTATPFTKGLGKYFDAVVNVTTTRALIDQGWLAPYRIFSCSQPNMDGVRVLSTGEWDSSETEKRALEVVGDVVQEYMKHADGRKFICSAVDTAHVEALVSSFQSAGINVVSYTYKDLIADRRDITDEFKKPDSSIKGIITVTAASRGFDVPDLGCVIMARPLRKALAEHIQLFGRGLRMAPGKDDVIILDHSGNAARFWAKTERFFDVGISELDDGKPKKEREKEIEEVEPVKCPSCGALHRPAPVCPLCGHQYPRRAPVQHKAGTLKELLSSGNNQIITRDIWPQICGYALERKQGDEARKMALAIYMEMVGTWPARRFEDTTPQPCGDVVRNRILYFRVKYQRSRRRA